jgi:hypothetical protein
MDNLINGAVLTFNKITPLKHMEYQLEGFRDYALTIIETFGDLHCCWIRFADI